MKPWIPAATENDPAGASSNRALRMLGLFDPEPSAELEAMVNIARAAFDCPIALINIFDGPLLRFKAGGGGMEGMARADSFCELARADDAMLVVEDAREDPRFCGIGVVTGEPGVRFYAGQPLHLRSANGDPGPVIGTLCIAATAPRAFSEADRAVLRDMAATVETVIFARKALTEAISIAGERAQRGRQLRRADRQFRQAERIANMGSWRYSIADQAIEWSDHVFAIYGLPQGSLPALDDALKFYPPTSRAILTAAHTHTLTTGEAFDIEVDFVTANGAERRVRVIGEREMANGAPVALIGVFQDITERHEMEVALRRSASIDDLTRLPNRAAFGRTLEDRIARARAGQHPLALLLIDLDGYKTINDSYGHVAGDEVLRVVAARLAAVPNGFAARLGGDELALILHDAESCERIEEVAAAVLVDIAAPLHVDIREIAVSGTIGIAQFEPGIDTMREFIQRADMALYQQKRERRGTARIFGEQYCIAPAPAHAQAA